MLEKLQYVLRSECIPNCSQQHCILSEIQNFNKSFEDPESYPFPASSLPELRKEKSLGIMSQKFIMLFLVSSVCIFYIIHLFSYLEEGLYFSIFWKL